MNNIKNVNARIVEGECEELMETVWELDVVEGFRMVTLAFPTSGWRGQGNRTHGAYRSYRDQCDAEDMMRAFCKSVYWRRPF